MIASFGLCTKRKVESKHVICWRVKWPTTWKCTHKTSQPPLPFLCTRKTNLLFLSPYIINILLRFSNWVLIFRQIKNSRIQLNLIKVQSPTQYNNIKLEELILNLTLTSGSTNGKYEYWIYYFKYINPIYEIRIKCSGKRNDYPIK